MGQTAEGEGIFKADTSAIPAEPAKRKATIFELRSLNNGKIRLRLKQELPRHLVDRIVSELARVGRCVDGLNDARRKGVGARSSAATAPP